MLYDGLLVLALWLITLLAMVVANGGEAVFGALVQTTLFLEAYRLLRLVLAARGPDGGDARLAPAPGFQSWRAHHPQPVQRCASSRL